MARPEKPELAAEALWETPRRRPGLPVREIEGETVILDPENERMHTLNPTAAFIFEAINGERNLRTITQMVTEHFDVGLDVAEGDAREVIRKLGELNLLA